MAYYYCTHEKWVNIMKLAFFCVRRMWMTYWVRCWINESERLCGFIMGWTMQMGRHCPSERSATGNILIWTKAAAVAATINKSKENGSGSKKNINWHNVEVLFSIFCFILFVYFHRFGISRERIRQIEDCAMHKLVAVGRKIDFHAPLTCWFSPHTIISWYSGPPFPNTSSCACVFQH